MHKARVALAAVAVAASALLAGAASAQAAPAANAPAANTQAAPGTSASPAQIASDGRFYAYNGLNYTNLCNSWSGNSSNWGACRNKSESLWNNGYPGGNDDVLVYWGTSYSGAWRGICNGAALADLRQWPYDYSGGASGNGQALWHNISSHKWAALGGPCA
jgi:hypothetical protein